MKLLLLLSCCLAYVNAVSFDEVVAQEWGTWKVYHGKNYSSNEEDSFRMKVFMDNKAKIAKHNALAHKGEATFTVKMNKFGDLLHHEFMGNMNGYVHDKKKKLNDALTHIGPANVDLPDEVDWRKHGAVTEVKDQKQCGSCWAFATTGALEGQHFRKTGKLVSLSEQNLVDCSRSFGNFGCNGGLMDNAFRYIKANGGIDTEKSYPYDGKDEQCNFSPNEIGATDKGFVDIPKGDEEALKAAVATVGPVAVAIDASNNLFQFYYKGVYNPERCSATELDHGVLVVGYGTTKKPVPVWENHMKPEKIDYWIVKNSWGSEQWGDKGYIKMIRNQNNRCGIASCASYPVV